MPFEMTNIITLFGNPAKMLSLSLNCIINVDDMNDVEDF